MVHYRRNRVAGGTYFFTVALRDRTARWLVERVDDLKLSIQSVKREQPFRIDALVVLPEHLHTVWSLPPEDDDYPGRWRLIKARFSRTLAKAGVGVQRNTTGEYDLWQRRYWEHTIRDEADLRRCVDYAHYNPVKHAWVQHVSEWPYSTFRHYVKNGVYSQDWAGGVNEGEGQGYGE